MASPSKATLPDDGTAERMKADGLNAMSGDLTDYNCSKCRNKGFVAEVEHSDTAGYHIVCRECSCMKPRKSLRLLRESGLERAIKTLTFDSYREDEDFQAAFKKIAQNYARHPEGWFFIGGQSGIGKTHLCTAICRQLLLDCREVIFMPWREDVRKLKSLSTDTQFDDCAQKYKLSEVLYIDDLFKTGTDGLQENKPTSADINIAFEILNHRYNNRMPTIISSELQIRDILKLDEALGGRIVEMARTPINVDKDEAKNWRLKIIQGGDQ